MSARILHEPAHITRQQTARTNAIRALIDRLTLAASLTVADVENLIQSGFLRPKQENCDHCGGELRLAADSRCGDKVAWRCQSTQCRRTLSIRAGSWFSGSKVTIIQRLLLIRKIELGLSFHQIEQEGIINHHAARQIWLGVVARMETWLDANIFACEFVFGTHELIEVDECYVHWKGPRYDLAFLDDEKAAPDGKWILGMINRSRSCCWLLPIEDRMRASIIEPIEDVVAPGAIILTDALNVYDVLNAQFDHHVINKKQDGFAQLQSCRHIGQLNVNVNHCESLWKDFRLLARNRHLTHCKDVPALCIEFMYKFFHAEFHEAIKC